MERDNIINFRVAAKIYNLVCGINVESCNLTDCGDRVEREAVILAIINDIVARRMFQGQNLRRA